MLLYYIARWLVDRHEGRYDGGSVAMTRHKVRVWREWDTGELFIGISPKSLQRLDCGKWLCMDCGKTNFLADECSCVKGENDGDNAG